MIDSPTAIDLFCGAGGLSTGLEWAGFDVLLGIDNDQKAAETYQMNHDSEVVCGDVSEITPDSISVDISEVDLVAGGPPCPTFSKMGRSKINSFDNRTPTDDDRHHLYEDFIRFVDTIQPLAFIMENVAGMRSATTADGRQAEQVITEEMEELGYRVNVQLVDSVDFGVPQKRERLFFIGNRINTENPLMEKWETHRPPRNESEREMKIRQSPSAFTESSQVTMSEFGLSLDEPLDEFTNSSTHKRPWETVADAILDLPPVSPDGERPPTKATEYTIGPVSQYQEWVRNIPENKSWEEMTLYNHHCRGHNMLDLTLYKLLGEGVGWNIGDVDEHLQPYRTDIFSDKYKKQNPRKPASTIIAHMQKDGHMFIHPREARSLTVREAARLQSFRDTFRFPESRTDGYRLVGNAVPPLLGKAVGAAVKTEIFDN